MDLYCQRCGEPYDLDHINFDMTTEERINFKDGKCCPCCVNKPVAERPARAEAMEVVRDLLGDDEDGMAAMMEDFEAFGL